MKTIYYYQTFVGLDKALTHIEDVDVFIVSSIHFGKDKNNIKSIYLNDNKPYDPIFNELWFQTEKASVQGCTIMLMIGGAGKAYKELFSDFNTYYPQLKQLIMEKSWIKGIDLDIEESTSIDNVKMLINRLVKDFDPNRTGDFIITMAPVSSTLSTDGSSFAGFNYKELYNSEVGVYIDWFNVQSYYSYTFETYDSIINNGYPPSKIVFGMESGQFKDNFNEAINEIKKIKNKYPDMAGVYDWEYFDAPPDKNEPNEWARLMKEIDR